MNPLGISQDRITVATRPSGGGGGGGGGEFLGMGQLVPIAPGLSELRSIVVARQHRRVLRVRAHAGAYKTRGARGARSNVRECLRVGVR